MATKAISDGHGNWISATADHTTNQPLDSSDESNPLDGLSKYREAKTIPKGFESVFNKILEHEYQGVVYRYREVSFMELISMGSNPYLLEAIGSAMDDKSVEQFIEDLSQKPEHEVSEMTAKAYAHRNKVLLHSLVDMKVKDQTMEITDDIIAAMKEDVLEELYSIISGDRTAETQAVRRFPSES